MKSIKVNREDNCIQSMSCKGKIQRYTRPLKISSDPEYGSTLPNPQLELFYFYILRASSDPDEENMN